MIEVQNLCKYYGQLAAIEDVTFSVNKGEIIGFLGPNGAGKTTTMRILTGYSPASKGRASVSGFDISRDPIEVKRRIGYMPENVPLYGEMLVFGFLQYVAEVKGVPRSRRKAEVERVMERCGLAHMSKRVVRNLSKGYRQRVGLAQALVGDPPVLILDEPTVGLDPKQIVEIRRMIKDLGAEHTVLLSTHILPEVTMVCERVIIINGGRIVAQDRVESLAEAAQTVWEIQTGGSHERVEAILKGVPGISTVSLERPGVYQIESGSTTTAGADAGSAAAKALVESGIDVSGLRRRVRTLEDIFIGVISGETSAEENAESAPVKGGAR